MYDKKGEELEERTKDMTVHRIRVKRDKSEMRQSRESKKKIETRLNIKESKIKGLIRTHMGD